MEWQAITEWSIKVLPVLAGTFIFIGRTAAKGMTTFNNLSAQLKHLSEAIEGLNVSMRQTQRDVAEIKERLSVVEAIGKFFQGH